MNNFWVNSPRSTFNRILDSGVYGDIDINVKSQKDKAFEAVMDKNNISYHKKEILDTSV